MILLCCLMKISPCDRPGLVQMLVVVRYRSSTVGKSPHTISNRRIPRDHTVMGFAWYLPLNLYSGGKNSLVPGRKKCLMFTTFPQHADYMLHEFLWANEHSSWCNIPQKTLKADFFMRAPQPKSIIFTSMVSWFTRRFSGLMSRWRTPLSQQTLVARMTCRITCCAVPSSRVPPWSSIKLSKSMQGKGRSMTMM